MTRPPYPFTRGFSLVEIVIAIGVIAVAGLALLGLMGVGLGAAREAKEETACGLVARFVFSDLETDAFSAEDPSATVVSPFNPANLSTGVTKRYYFTQEGVFLGNTLPGTPDPKSSPFFLAEAVAKTPAAVLAPGVSSQGVSPKELRSVSLTISWPIDPATGAVPTGARTSNFGFLLGKKIYRKSLEGDR